MSTEIIPTEELALSLVPDDTDDLNAIFKFALTFDLDEIDYEFKLEPFPDLEKQKFSLRELRAHLFSKQRAWNHMMKSPDRRSEDMIRKLVRLIREKIQQTK